MRKQLYIKSKDTYAQADDFYMTTTPLGLNSEQGMPADRRSPTMDQGPSEYDASTSIESDNS